MKALLATCGAHAIQDGLVAIQFVLLPVLAQSLGLSYSQVGILKAANNIATSVLEIPSGFLAEKFGEKKLLIFGLLCAGIGYIGVSQSGYFATVCFFFLITGCGAAFQHSLSSALIVNNFQGGLRRKTLGTYNAFGDVGKLLYTGSFSLLMGIGLAWNSVVLPLAISACVFAIVVWQLLPDTHTNSRPTKRESAGKGTWGIRHPTRFSALGTMVLLDSMVQSGFFTFIAFVLIEKGASASHAAGGVVLTLIGGTAGKLAGGFLASRLGDRASFNLIQVVSIVGIIAIIFLPLQAVFIILPLVGIFVQGSSTICYGAVAEQVEEDKTARGYAVIYTLAAGASAIGPATLGIIADIYSLTATVWMLAALTALTVLFSVTLSGRQYMAKPV
ncbi:hypothetical protein AB833_05575 [Chromatiales bacterium (ex Bugula neritina AB1)]|nr:hypothetical protein AB833_05575 [Chromatiales bacterium (ex Bugula neritina AB1)]